MHSYLVEAYVASVAGADLDALVHRARAVESDAVIRYWGSLVLPEDEICFHIFDAPSVALLLRASDRAELAYDRVVETIWIPPERA